MSPVSGPDTPWARRGGLFTPPIVGGGEPPDDGVRTIAVLTAVSGEYISTPDTAANSITSDIDIVWRGSLTDWTAVSQGFANKYGGAGQRSWRFFTTTGGAIRLDISGDGTTPITATSSAAPSFGAGVVGWVRATWNNTSNVVQFFTAPDADTPEWVQLGTDQSINLTGIFNSTSTVSLGCTIASGTAGNINGTIHYFELRSSIGGAAVNVFDPSEVEIIGTRDPSTVLASTGETWTLNGSAWDWDEFEE